MSSSSSESTDQLRPKLQLYCIQQLSALKEPRCGLDVTQTLLRQIQFLCGGSVSNTVVDDAFSSFSMQLVRNEFKKSFYFVCMRAALTQLNPNESTEAANLADTKAIIVQIMSDTNFSDSFNILHELCTSTKYTLSIK